MKEPGYILITAARNEESYIGHTLQSVVAQTHLPLRWLIVNDGSTDRTEALILEQAARHPFIELLKAQADAVRNFGSKAKAIQAGYERVKELPATYVGILDADVSFEPDYYKQVMARMEQDPALGIGGGVLLDCVRPGRYEEQITAREWSVSGPIQLFRKACWDAIGGYLPIRGGIDATAEVMARMKGWKVQAFPELKVLHHRTTGTEGQSLAKVFFRRGVDDWQLGYAPLFFLGHALRRGRERPWLVGSLLMLAGFAWAALRGGPRKVPDDFVRFLRAEQQARLRALLRPRRGDAP